MAVRLLPIPIDKNPHLSLSLSLFHHTKNHSQPSTDASSISAALIGQPSWYAYMNLVPNTPHCNAILGAINGVYAAGGAFGCVFNMWSSERFGRKRSIQIGCVISIVGAAIMTASVDIPMFIVSRFIMGFGIGVLVTLVPLYQSEVSPPESRGLMVGLHGVLIGFSYSLTGFITYGCYFAPHGQFQWRESCS